MSRPNTLVRTPYTRFRKSQVHTPVTPLAESPTRQEGGQGKVEELGVPKQEAKRRRAKSDKPSRFFPKRQDSVLPAFSALKLTTDKLSSFTLEQPKGRWSDDQLTLDEKRDDYKLTFGAEENMVFVVQESKGERAESSFVVVLHRPSPGPLFRALHITKNGHHTFELPLGNSISEDFVDCIADSIQKKTSCSSVYYVSNPAIRHDLFNIERKHPQHIPAQKIGIVYYHNGQIDLQVSNGECSSKFWEFVSLMGYKIDLTNWGGFTGDMRNHEDKETYFTQWKEKDIIFHVAPMLNSEAIRRLIGNDIVIIVFTEDGEFNPSVLTQLGSLPQIIFVVRPSTSSLMVSSTPAYPATPSHRHSLSVPEKIERSHISNKSPHYRLSVFKTNTLPSIEPPIPDEDLDVNQLRDLLFTKAFNGLI
eukprot:TRINITY_DN19378_c0_g1_i3.p1 TRINITY_DN19378_c0_g1~~TRINITY_DN19378_c0_g1_i3.p1  ORF type:complete len:477 (+),score=91.12 TRINITY_DN19378_c0_g1_i3:175-1431(+)